MNDTKDLVCEFIIKDPKSQDLLTIVGKINESQITDFFRENSPTYVYLQDRPYPPIPKESIREIIIYREKKRLMVDNRNLALYHSTEHRFEAVAF